MIEVQLLILNINGENNMKHTYLSETVVSDALLNKAITEQEAQKLMKKIDCQVTIYKTITK